MLAGERKARRFSSCFDVPEASRCAVMLRMSFVDCCVLLQPWSRLTDVPPACTPIDNSRRRSVQGIDETRRPAASRKPRHTFEQSGMVIGSDGIPGWDGIPASLPMSYSDVVQGITADEKDKSILKEQTQRFSAMKLATDGFEPCDSNGEKLVAGTRVQLFGLQARPDLNNTYGRIVTYNAARGRFGVQREEMVDDSKRTGQILFVWVGMEQEAPIAVKPEKLRNAPRLPAAIGTAAGSRRAYALNAKYVLDWLDTGGHIEARHPVCHDTVLTLACAVGASALVCALVERGANVNARALKETTPLMYAAFAGHSEIVHTLLSAGARVNAVNSDGRTALNDAMMNCHTEVATMLREFGAFGIVSPQGFEQAM